MAGETGNIAAAAERISAEIFGEFGWVTCGTSNENWACVHKTDHEKSSHPTDVVFCYAHPYFNRNVYINCDLKSYKAKSISKASISGSVTNLIKATECAQVSDEWHERYTFRDYNREIVGMLFIYNHDGEYDKDFNSYLEGFSKEDFKMRKGCKVFILNPETICYLKTISNDIKTLRGDKKLGDKETYSFFYPEQHFSKLMRDENKAATVETLLGPWQIIKHTKEDRSNGLIVYLRTSEATVDEFTYFIDYLFRYQLIHYMEDISIRVPFGADGAASNFEKAADHYAYAISADNEISKRLAKIKFAQLTAVFTHYSSIDIGMRNASQNY